VKVNAQVPEPGLLGSVAVCLWWDQFFEVAICKLKNRQASLRMTSSHD